MPISFFLNNETQLLKGQSSVTCIHQTCVCTSLWWYSLQLLFTSFWCLIHKRWDFLCRAPRHATCSHPPPAPPPPLTPFPMSFDTCPPTRWPLPFLLSDLGLHFVTFDVQWLELALCYSCGLYAGDPSLSVHYVCLHVPSILFPRPAAHLLSTLRLSKVELTMERGCVTATMNVSAVLSIM